MLHAGLNSGPWRWSRIGVRDRWAIKNQWHWPRDTQLGEDAHQYVNRNAVQVLALLRTLALNLLRCNGFIRPRLG